MANSTHIPKKKHKTGTMLNPDQLNGGVILTKPDIHLNAAASYNTWLRMADDGSFRDSLDANHGKMYEIKLNKHGKI